MYRKHLNVVGHVGIFIPELREWKTTGFAFGAGIGNFYSYTRSSDACILTVLMAAILKSGVGQRRTIFDILLVKRYILVYSVAMLASSIVRVMHLQYAWLSSESMQPSTFTIIVLNRSCMHEIR